MKWHIVILTGIMIMMGCSPTEPAAEIAAGKLIDSLVTIIEQLDTREALAYWNATETGSQDAYTEMEAASLVRNKLYSDRNVFKKLAGFYHDKSLRSAELKRQVEILYLDYLSYQTDEELLNQTVALQTTAEQQFNTFRGTIDGKPVTGNEINDILRTSTDSEKSRKAWEASKQIGPVISNDLIKLAKLRNEAARQAGFANYYEMQLATQEQSVDQIVKIFDELANKTDEPFHLVKNKIDATLAKKFDIQVNQLEPWHYADAFFQVVPEVSEISLDKYYEDKDVVDLAGKFYAGIGLPVDDILAHSSLYEKEGKYPHAYCTSIDKKGDVRIMMNVTPSEGWMSTSLHELGHALYDLHIDRDMPYLFKNPSHSFTTEAVAMFFEKLSKNPAWMDAMFGIPAEEKEPIASASGEILLMEKLLFSRWAQVMMRFEKGFYENPDRDLNQFWWELVEKYQFIRKPDGRNMPDWATKIHVCAYPVYYHNYMLGELMVSQLLHTVKTDQKVTDNNKINYIENMELGRFFKEQIFEPGKKYRWDELIVRATGEPLNPVYFIEQF